MQDSPQTLEQAQRHRYGCWAGNPKGSPYDPKCCAYVVWPKERGSIAHQCGKPPGHGPAGLYCKCHADLLDTSLQERLAEERRAKWNAEIRRRYNLDTIEKLTKLAQLLAKTLRACPIDHHSKWSRTQRALALEVFDDVFPDNKQTPPV